MHQLHFVGFTADHDGLIFSTRRDATSGAYVVGIDDALFSALEEARRSATAESDDPTAQTEAERVKALRPTQRSSLSVRDIQSRLRTGITLSEVANEAGVDEDWVARFAAPVLAEQAAVVERALPMTFITNRKGPSSRPLGDAVRWNLADRRIAVDAGAQAAGWTAFQMAPGQWGVRFSYLSRGRQQVAEWEVSFEADELVARNRLASELAYVEAGARRRLQPEPSAATPSSTPKKAPASRRNPPGGTATARTRASKAATSKAVRAASSKPTTASATSSATRPTAANSATKKAAATKRVAATKKAATKKAATKKAATKKAATTKAATTKAAKKAATKKAATKKAATTKNAAAAKATAARKAARPTPASRGAAGSGKRGLGASALAPAPSAAATPAPVAGAARFPAPRPAAARVGTPSAPATAAPYQPAPPAPPVARRPEPAPAPRRPEPAPAPRPPVPAPAPRVASSRPAQADPKTLRQPRPAPTPRPPAEAARPAARVVPEPIHRAGLEPTLRRVAPPTPPPPPRLTADARAMPVSEPAPTDAPPAVTPLDTSPAVRRLPSPSAASGRSAEARRAAARSRHAVQPPTPPEPQQSAQPEAQPSFSRPAPVIVRPVGGTDGRPTILIIDAERASDRRRS